MTDEQKDGPLSGYRVLEIGHYIAAPFCARLLADLGADIVKIEPPAGDPVRLWGKHVNGVAPWWSQHARNKRSLSLNLKHPDAMEIVKSLVRSCDAVVENFRPGQLEKWGLGDEILREAKPDIVIAHISGFGQDGPHRDRAAFGVIAEAVGGMRYLTNHRPGQTDLPPVRVGVSIGDSVAGLYAALGIVAALLKNRSPAKQAERGETIDVALADSVLSLMEGLVPDYGTFGEIRQPVGAGITTAAPSGAYPTKDGAWILVAANSDPLFIRLAGLMGSQLDGDPRFRDNRCRVSHADELDGLISNWTRSRTLAELEQALIEADIPCARVSTAQDVVDNVQFRFRNMIQPIPDPLIGEVFHTGIVPRFQKNPGRIRWTGPSVGQHTDAILEDFLGYDECKRQSLRSDGVI
ncbi:MAG: CoA transferase [Hyphomicrobiales bacterium]|nr:CoA transferase [Hyphomicrobiales bacterium]